MTPKEKAEELFDKMSTNNGDEHHHCTYYVAKQCALIAIDEMIEVVRNACDEELLGIQIIYLLKVKQEIEKL